MELNLVAFLLLAFIGFLTLIILIVHLVHGQDDVKRLVNHSFFIAVKTGLGSGPWCYS